MRLTTYRGSIPSLICRRSCWIAPVSYEAETQELGEERIEVVQPLQGPRPFGSAPCLCARAHNGNIYNSDISACTTSPLHRASAVGPPFPPISSMLSSIWLSEGRFPLSMTLAPVCRRQMTLSTRRVHGIEPTALPKAKTISAAQHR